jgi:hypothetical protein
VEEYYVYDPHDFHLSRWIRGMPAISAAAEWTSRRLNVRFTMNDEGLQLYLPDGAPFLTGNEMVAHAQEATPLGSEARHESAEAARRAAEADSRASLAEERAAKAQREVERLRSRLQELGVDPE